MREPLRPVNPFWERPAYWMHHRHWRNERITFPQKTPLPLLSWVTSSGDYLKAFGGVKCSTKRIHSTVAIFHHHSSKRSRETRDTHAVPNQLRLDPHSGNWISKFFPETKEKLVLLDATPSTQLSWALWLDMLFPPRRFSSPRRISVRAASWISEASGFSLAISICGASVAKQVGIVGGFLMAWCSRSSILLSRHVRADFFKFPSPSSTYNYYSSNRS